MHILTSTFGLLNWSLQELSEMDVRTRKLLRVTGNFNINGDVDRLYFPRKEGGRGLKSVLTSYETRIVTLKQHLLQRKKFNSFLAQVCEHEDENIIRIANELEERHEMKADIDLSPRNVGKSY